MVKIIAMPKTLSLHLTEFEATPLYAYAPHVDTIYVYADGYNIKCTCEPHSEYAFTHDNKSYSLTCDSSKKVRVTRIESIDLASQYI